MPRPTLSTITEQTTRPQTRRRAVRATDPTGRVDIAAEKLACMGLDMLGTWLGVPGISDQLRPQVRGLVRQYLPNKPVFTRRQLELAQAQAAEHAQAQHRGVA